MAKTIHVVIRGKTPGLYHRWNEVSESIRGVRNAVYFKYMIQPDDPERVWEIYRHFYPIDTSTEPPTELPPFPDVFNSDSCSADRIWRELEKFDVHRGSNEPPVVISSFNPVSPRKSASPSLPSTPFNLKGKGKALSNFSSYSGSSLSTSALSSPTSVSITDTDLSTIRDDQDDQDEIDRLIGSLEVPLSGIKIAYRRSLKSFGSSVYEGQSLNPSIIEPKLSKYFARYVRAHNFDEQSILLMERIHEISTDARGEASKDTFVKLLTDREFPKNEAEYIFDLIEGDGTAPI